MIIEVDFSTVKERDWSIPKNQYLAEIISATTKPQKDGTAIVWTFAIIEPGPYEGRTIEYRTGLADQRDSEAQERAKHYLKVFLDTIGCPYEPHRFDLNNAMGCKALIFVGEWQGQDGKPRPNIERVMKYMQ